MDRTQDPKEQEHPQSPYSHRVFLTSFPVLCSGIISDPDRRKSRAEKESHLLMTKCSLTLVSLRLTLSALRGPVLDTALHRWYLDVPSAPSLTVVRMSSATSEAEHYP
jgi:hypothetical protein